MTKDTTTTRLDEQRTAVKELTSDRARIRELIAGAEDRLRAARRKDDTAIRSAALEVAGLRAALDDVNSELDSAAAHLADLERQHQLDLDRKEADAIRNKLDRLRVDVIQSINAAADAALTSVRHAAKADEEARALHNRYTALAANLGESAPPAYRPVRAREAQDAREDALQEDVALVDALIAATQSHPVAHGRKRSDVTHERRDRNARGRLQSAQSTWDARAELVRRWQAGAVRSDQVDLAREYAAWLDRNPRPEEPADLIGVLA